jgi:predicted methyltransferase
MARLPVYALPFVLAAGLTACGAPDPAEPAGDAGAATETVAQDEAPAPDAPDVTTLSGAIEAPWRDEAARSRDAARNPAETLDFFEVDPAGTVIEIWPGAGWYADILAPWVSANGGTYVAAWPPVAGDNERAARFRDRFAARFDGGARGAAQLVPFGPGQTALAEAGPADAILTFRNVHNFMAAGFAETAFESFFDALKPGGVLGVVEHRLPADRVQDPRAASGYVQQDYVITLAREAGFEFVAASEINANPADTADHPFGVWTLPPVARTSAFGEPADPAFDRSGYDAIGESDRMTLLFRRPAAGSEDGAEADPAP